jgi:small multidrug resistance family-3 protein
MNLQNIPPAILLVVATSMEVTGDAVVRLGLHDQQTAIRACLFIGGAALLFGYGFFLNLAPIEFGQVVGLYIAILFISWQVINYAFFRTIPTLPVALGGAMIVGGGLVVTYWKA